ncbi:MAG: hypothetical protein FGM61_06730 [Sediminibacterium sp.]|nr:hypothetical protein [Sediminibacterium sp.]
MKNSLLLLLTFIFLYSSISAQQILVRTADTFKIKAALGIIQQFEPEIYQRIVVRTCIQLGELENKPRVSFAIADEQSGIKRYWIMLNPNIMQDLSIQVIASILLHEAMHNGYNMSVYQKINTESFDEEVLHEHIHIYNYELKFLRKIHASAEDIQGRIQVMKKLSIPIL